LQPDIERRYQLFADVFAGVGNEVVIRPKEYLALTVQCCLLPLECKLELKTFSFSSVQFEGCAKFKFEALVGPFIWSSIWSEDDIGVKYMETGIYIR
jgi:hypothetical protein